MQHHSEGARGGGGSRFGGGEFAPWIVLGLLAVLAVGSVTGGLAGRSDGTETGTDARNGEGEWPNDGTYPRLISDADFERRTFVAEMLRTNMIAAVEPMGQTRDLKVVFTDGSRAIFKEDPPPDADPWAASYLDYRIDYQGWSEVLAAHLNDILGYYAAPVTVRREVGGRTGALIEWMHWDDVVNDPGLDLADLTDRFIFGYLADDKDATTDRHRKRLRSHTYHSAGKQISKPLHLDNGLAFILMGDEASPMAEDLAETESALQRQVQDMLKGDCILSPATEQAIRRFRKPGKLSRALQKRAALETISGEESLVPAALNTPVGQLADLVDARFQRVIEWSRACSLPT